MGKKGICIYFSSGRIVCKKLEDKKKLGKAVAFWLSRGEKMVKINKDVIME